MRHRKKKFVGKRFLGLAMASVLAFPSLTGGLTAYAAETVNMEEETPLADTATTITIKGSDVDTAAKNINGWSYKGFGMLNGNSTSNLLLDYKYQNKEKYDKMMRYLFGGEYPLFTHIKMEMGNDGNNSTGAESCTMRSETEEADASRSPGFVMAADAKAINPNVKISILRWEMPNWVSAKGWPGTNNAGYEAVYKWYKETIFDAYEKYGYVVDFVNPDKNETKSPDAAFIKWFSDRIKNETEFPAYMDAAAQTAYKNIRIIASDENKTLNIVPAMREDTELYNAVDIIGFHYRTNATDDYVKMADVDDKEVWYSEGCATFGYTELHENKTIAYGADSIGGYQSPLALMDSFITAFDSSRRTHYIFQPAVGSFYEGIQYGHKELLAARDPWSGYIHYDPALYMLEHYAKFAKTGWEDSDPTQNEIWRVICSATDSSYEGSSDEHATAGIDGKAGYMTLASPDKENFSVVFVNNTRNAKSFRINAEGMGETANGSLHFWVTETDQYMQDKGSIEKDGSGWNVTIPAYSIATATTLDTTPERTPKEDIHNEDRSVLDTDASGSINGKADDTVLYADNFEYAEYDKNYLAERGNEPRYMLDTHGAWVVENGALKQELASKVKEWNSGEPSTIVGDFRWMDYTASVDVRIPNASSSTYARLTVRSQSGMNWNNSGYTLSINGSGAWELYRIDKQVSSGTVEKNAEGKYKVRLMAIGNTIRVIINDEIAADYQDTVPMLSGRVKLSSTWNQVYFDNLLVETVQGGIPYATAMVDGQDDCVTYEGTWTIDNPGTGSADNWYRSMSVTKTANAAFSFPINGCGFSILGTNDGTAKLDIYVDDEKKAEDVSTLASPIRGETYSLSDLAAGEHKIKVVVKSGTLNIDALYTLGERLAPDENALVSVKTEMPSFDEITTDMDAILKKLPTEVEVVTGKGETVQKSIVWDTSAGQFDGKEFRQASITGTVQGGANAVGVPLTVSVPVKMVVPAETYYFIDSVEGIPAANATTEPYETIKTLVGDKLLNQASDQLKKEDNTWGLVTTTAKTKSYTGTTDMTATGIYGNDKVGDTLSYAFTLPAGKYKLISGHRDWWSVNQRSFKASISYGNTNRETGTINVSKTGTDAVNTAKFEIDSEQLVTYTLTSTNAQAPVISWLAVVRTGDVDPGEINFKSVGYRVIKKFGAGSLTTTEIGGNTGLKIAIDDTTFYNEVVVASKGTWVKKNEKEEDGTGYYPYGENLNDPEEEFYLFLGVGDGKASANMTLTLPNTVKEGDSVTIKFARPRVTNNGSADRTKADPGTITLGSQTITIGTVAATVDTWVTETVTLTEDIDKIGFTFNGWGAVAIASIKIPVASSEGGNGGTGNSESSSQNTGNSEGSSQNTGNSESEQKPESSEGTSGSEQQPESSEGTSGSEQPGSSEKPNLTEEQKKQVDKLTNQLGVSEETAIKIQTMGEQYSVPEATLLISNKTITGQKSDADIKGSSFALLQARAAKITKNQIQLKWTKVKGADGYLIYGNKCGKGNKYKLIKTIKEGSSTSFTQKKLKKGTFYKYIVRAYKEVDGQKVTLAASKTVHIVTKGGKDVNERSVSVKKTKVSLKKGKSHTIKATAVKGPKKPHRKIAYESTDPKVAKVSAKGKITAVGKGKCTVYVYSQSGLFQKITVTVK